MATARSVFSHHVISVFVGKVLGIESQMRSSERSAQTFKQARKQERFPFLTTHSPPKTFFFWSKIIARQFV